MDKPILTKQAFWDVDMDKIDYDKNSAHVIQKVFDRGSIDDIVSVLNFYGNEKIKLSLLGARYLMNNTMAFACILFGLNLEDFRCYKIKQSSPSAWPF